MLLVGLIFMGCEETPDPVVPPVVDNDTTVELTPVWTPDELKRNLNTLMGYGIPNPFAIMDRYVELYDEGGTPSCPGTNYNFDGAEADNVGCYTEAGYFYAGLGETRIADDGFDLHCDCRIVSPDGRMIRGAGNIGYREDENGTMLDIRGSFLEIKNEYEGTWLEELPSTNMTMIYSDGETYISGGYTINGISIYMENYHVGECVLRDGTLYFRDPSGGWWTWTSKGSCTEGQLAFQGQDYGSWTWDSEQLDVGIALIMERL